MLAAGAQLVEVRARLPSGRGAVLRTRRQSVSPRGMIDLANVFVLLLLGAAAWVGVSALVQKRTVRRDRTDERSSNAAS